MDSDEHSAVSLTTGMLLAGPPTQGSLSCRRPQVAVTAPLEHSDCVPGMTEVGANRHVVNSLYLIMVAPECSTCHRTISANRTHCIVFSHRCFLLVVYPNTFTLLVLICKSPTIRLRHLLALPCWFLKEELLTPILFVYKYGLCVCPSRNLTGTGTALF